MPVVGQVSALVVANPSIRGCCEFLFAPNQNHKPTKATHKGQFERPYH